MELKKIGRGLLSPRIILPVTAFFYLVGLIGHSYSPTFSMMLKLTPWVIFIFGAWVFAAAVFSSDKKLILWAVITYSITFFLEVLGVATGAVFGEYHYGPTLGLMVFRVPVVIGFNWTIIILALSETIRRLKGNIYLSSLLAASGAVVFDILLEPVAMALDYWQWKEGTVPLQNYGAWFLIAFAFSFLYRKMKIKTNTLLPIGYIGIQWLFFVGLVVILLI